MISRGFKVISRIHAAVIVAMLAVAFALPASAQVGVTYAKTEPLWYQQGKISGGISVTNSSTRTLLPTTGFVAWICNTGANDAYLGFGDVTITATTTAGSWLKAGTCGNYDLFPPVGSSAHKTYVAAITASSTTTLTVETGLGSGPSQVGPASVTGTVTANQGTAGAAPWPVTIPSGSPGSLSDSITNPSSTLQMTSTTTAFTAGQLIATSATAGSIVNPSFAIANSAGGVAIPRVRLYSNDATSTSWGGQTIQVTLWTASPTWTNGSRAAWSPATGTASHVASYNCTMSAVYGDGSYASCSITQGNFALVKLASGTTIYWALQAVSGSGVTGASKVFTLVPEIMN